MRLRTALPFALLLSAFAAAYAAGDKKEPAKGSDQPTALEPFKQLAGEWVGKAVGGEKDGEEIHAKYKVTSGGSAVVETIFPDTDHEMVTVIHQDGDALALTHYCMLGNQQHMKTDGPPDGKTVAFQFAGASNLKSDKDMYMHDVTYTFVDKDTLKSEWTHFHDGKAAGKVVIELKRKK
jgi:hypothetical protein